MPLSLVVLEPSGPVPSHLFEIDYDSQTCIIVYSSLKSLSIALWYFSEKIFGLTPMHSKMRLISIVVYLAKEV